MGELIKIDPTTPVGQGVLGRELHAFLEVETPYDKWFPRMAEYDFTEGKDYSTFLSNRSDGLPGKPRIDHAVSLGMAKEISMLQRSEKGKQARRYFIDCEERLRAQALEVSGEALVEKALLYLAAQKEALALQVQVEKPLTDFAKRFQAHDVVCDFQKVAHVLASHGVDIGRTRLFEVCRSKHYITKVKDGKNPIWTQKAIDAGIGRNVTKSYWNTKYEKDIPYEMAYWTMRGIQAIFNSYDIPADKHEPVLEELKALRREELLAEVKKANTPRL